MANPVTPEGIARFVSVFERAKFNGEEKKYEVTCLFDKQQDISSLYNAAQQAATEAFGTTNNIKNPFVDGDTKDYKGAAGRMAVKFSSERPPVAVENTNDGMQEIINPNDLYDGCIVKVSYNTYTYGGKGTGFAPGVAFGLQCVLKVQDGERLGSTANPEADFGAPMANNQQNNNNNAGFNSTNNNANNNQNNNAGFNSTNNNQNNTQQQNNNAGFNSTNNNQNNTQQQNSHGNPFGNTKESSVHF